VNDISSVFIELFCDNSRKQPTVFNFYEVKPDHFFVLLYRVKKYAKTVTDEQQIRKTADMPLINDIKNL